MTTMYCNPDGSVTMIDGMNIRTSRYHRSRNGTTRTSTTTLSTSVGPAMMSDGRMIFPGVHVNMFSSDPYPPYFDTYATDHTGRISESIPSGTNFEVYNNTTRTGHITEVPSSNSNNNNIEQAQELEMERSARHAAEKALAEETARRKKETRLRMKLQQELDSIKAGIRHRQRQLLPNARNARSRKERAQEKADPIVIAD